MRYTDDPVSDFLDYDAEQEKRLSKLPLCIECDNPITDEHCYYINGEYICEDCMNGNYRVWVEDIIE